MSHLVNDDNVFYTLEDLIEKYDISTSFLELLHYDIGNTKRMERNPH